MVAVARTLRVLDPDARARLGALAPRLAPQSRAAERIIEVHPALASVFPQGLVRGSSVGCQGASAMSTAWLLASAASQAGAWVGVAGLADLGVQAVVEAGVVIERVVMVRERPAEHRRDEEWGQVLAAMIDGFDLVVFGAAARVRASTARRIQSRLKSRGAVLVVVGQPGGFGCDLEVQTTSRWHGLGGGHGHLRTRQVAITVQGRRMPRPRHDTVWFPGVDGQITPVSVERAPLADDVSLSQTG